MNSISERKLHHLETIAAEKAVGSEPGHDILHVRRVARSARIIAETESADASVAVAAALLHEVFNYPKDHPDKALSGDVCATMAAAIMRSEEISDESIDAVAYCIRVHPFSLGVVPTTIEGKILQDADRLDALGAAGVARVFSTGSALGRPFYANDDPFCKDRLPDDGAYTLDHFYRKLLRLPEFMHTATGRRIGVERARFLEVFLGQLAQEIG